MVDVIVMSTFVRYRKYREEELLGVKGDKDGDKRCYQSKTKKEMLEGGGGEGTFKRTTKGVSKKVGEEKLEALKLKLLKMKSSN